MASQEPVTQPLRISKNTPNASPTKSSLPRPLSEISSTEKRRNSPSWPQPKGNHKATVSQDSSPFQSSPLEGATSPRLRWQNRPVNTSKVENDLYGGASPSPKRRASVERLQQASRVKNSTMFAREQKQEYDPTRIPTVERPLAKVQGNAYAGTGASGFRASHARSESQTNIPIFASPTKSTTTPNISPSRPITPSKDQASPTKSSLAQSRFKSSQDSHTLDFSELSFDDYDSTLTRSMRQHAKSVTFDAAPPQINEYEMATPDLSSIGTNSREGSFESEEDEDDVFAPYSMDHSDLQEDSFDASLEDTDKTPVVGPDDWRHAHRFDSSPMPEGSPSQPSFTRPHHGRTNSATSSGEHRPLPPLPGMGHGRTHSNSSSTTAERYLSSSRNMGSSSPPGTLTKSDIQNIGNGNMSLEERLKLMMLSDETSPKPADNAAKTFAEQQRERRMRRAGARDKVGSPTPERESSQNPEAGEEDDTVGDLSALDMDYQLPSISRQSILNRVNGGKGAPGSDNDYDFGTPAPDSSPSRPAPADPDVPIASIEESILEEQLDDEDSEADDSIMESMEEVEDSVIINRDLCEPSDFDDDTDSLTSSGDYDTDSRYSDELSEADSAAPVETEPSSFAASCSQPADESTMTPRAGTPVQDSGITNFNATLPLASNGAAAKEANFSRSLQSYMLPKPKEADALTHSESRRMSEAETERPETPKQRLSMSKPEYDGTGWGDSEEEEPGTPESVIHHPVSDDDFTEEESYLEEPVESPAVEEQIATIKSASGSKLKTRLSATPSDLSAMREARRQVSHEVPNVPQIPDKHLHRLSRDLDLKSGDATGEDYVDRHPSFKKRSLTLDLDLGLSLDQDFERVIEAQKVAYQTPSLYHGFAGITRSPTRQVSGARVNMTTNHDLNHTNANANITSRKQRGYLMRQNTKLVTASDRPNIGGGHDDHRAGSRTASNSPVKQQDHRPQSWTVEPWNPKARKSLRKRPESGMSGPVPPMPGHESNANTNMKTVPEDEAPELATEECGERGRLFVKVMGVKDLDLPLPRNERTWFSLTLDNGVHCVTTAWLELARNAPIGQEFELVVPNDLEFQLTLNVKLEPPEPQQLPTSPSKMPKPKPSKFSRVFASPKKRKELEARQMAEEEAFQQAQRDATRQRKVAPSAWDLLSPLAAEDGSFARSYVCLKEHESRCYGRPYMAEVAAFNEWAIEEPNFANSVKSKRTGTTTTTSSSVVRRAPYKIGKLELQLLFVPRPKGSTDDDMPKSMNSCIRELKAAEERLSRTWEGHLSQQGGDCPYWRRRYFKLVGTKLTAYHETTRQPRATINLANGKRLIDDRRQLTNPETTGRGGKRRRSAFAEEEEGYMFVEEGFRMRFNNGEVIDFYADTREEKEGWMRVLADVIGRGCEEDLDPAAGAVNSRRKWCELILKREEALRKRAEGRRVHSKTKSMIY